MSTLSQVQQPSSQTRQFTEAQMKRYFAKISLRAIVTAVVGALIIIIGLSLQSTFVILLGFVILLIGAVPILLKVIGSAPTDQEYDAWLDTQAQMVYMNGLSKLGIDSRQITGKPLEVHGFVLNGMQGAGNYRAEELQWKVGSDGKPRFSVNIYTFFFPEEHHLAAFVGDINALNQGAHNEHSEEYFYRDIVGATTSDVHDTIVIKNNKYQYRVQKFALKISSGDEIGASISAKPVDNKQNIPTFSLPDSGVDRTMAQLRTLLRAKKQSNM